MKKSILFIAIAGFILASCTEEKDPFLITGDSVGKITKEMRMKHVDSIFAEDSIVKLSRVKNALDTQGEVEIYSKEGEKLLLISPEDENDPESYIDNIQVFDSRYKTEKGLTKASTFKDVKDNYTVEKVENAINSVIVFLKDSEVYLTIDKKQLPENLRYNPDAKIEASQIPNEATIKYFMIGWDIEEPDYEISTDQE
ncbi:hypothetical protein [Luteirhabdus pelagi]|uniref:hypothetical protein n=1 Tax=Luteirhabdus pelagi TaxID=2792783 RepID=UPI0019399151|nr:hypothetical protein [Luteirhabdus pelagi]